MSKPARFKATERRVARMLGAQRVGHLGGADVTSDWLAAEVKERQTLPLWLLQAMRQAVGHADPLQLPVVVLHQCGQKHADSLVILRLADFADWFGPGASDETEQPGPALPSPVNG